MMSKYVETEFVSTKEILKFPDHYVALAVMVDDDGVQANDDGKKIVSRGTIVGGKTGSGLADAAEPVVEKFADPAVEATLVTGADLSADSGDNNKITWTAVTAGHFGNLVSVELFDPGTASQSLSVSVTGFKIKVSLETTGAKAIDSSAADVVAAVNAHAGASLLVSAAGAGTDVVAAVPATRLTGGADPAVTGAEGVLMNDVDVTHGSAEGALLIHGFVDISKLPYGTDNNDVAAAAASVLPMIKFIG